MAKIIMAVGRGLGPWYDPNQPDKKEPEYFEIGAGSLVGEFTAEQALVWDAAHQSVEAQVKHEFTRAALEKVAQSTYGISNPGPSVDFLLSEGVLVEADLLSDIPVDFLKRYRLIPAAACSGNLPDNRDHYGLSVRGELVATITHRAKAIWEASYLEASIWAACKKYSSVYKRAGKDYPPEAFADEIARFLPAIVATGAGVVEPI